MDTAHGSHMPVIDDDRATDDRLIRELLQNWVVWRDAGDWERFRSVWHPDGRMMATWTQGTADEFIAISKAGWAKVSASCTSSAASPSTAWAPERYRRPR